MSENKFSVNGPKLSKSDVKALILGAEKDLIDSLPSKKMPWDDARIDVIKLMNVRIPEEYFMKLDYLSKTKRISKNKLCLEAIINEIDRMLWK